MTRADIARLGGLLIGGGIRPVKREHGPGDPAEVFGFDTEYTSAGADLLCYQLWHPESGGRLVEARRLGVKSLQIACEAMVRRKCPRILLLTWYSLAEIQHLDLTKCTRLKVYARGSMDVEWETERGTVEIYDLARWYDGASLARAAESIGEKKGEWRRDSVTRRDLHSPVFREYAVQDAKLCRVLYDRLAAEFGKDGIDILEIKTPASASARLFRKRITEPILCPPEKVRRLAARCTWGGRAEAFARGSWERATEWDLKSAYPSAAVAIGRFPVAESWEEVSSAADFASRPGFGRVRFAFPEKTYAPCLPIEADGKNIWPLVGESWASSFEIVLALKMGANVSLVEGYVYHGGTDALSKYMADCMKWRGESKAAARQKWKLCANALVGKFAQRTPRTADDLAIADAAEISPEVFFSCTPEERVEIARLIGWNLSINTGPVWYPEWQGLITGYVRAQIGEALWGAGVDSLYVHTDSLWTLGRAAACEGNAAWEEKGKGRAIVARTRFGSLGDHLAHHAVHSRAVAAEMLERFARSGKDVEVGYERKGALKFREALRSGRVREVGRWETREMTADTAWCGKRRLLPDGSTRPWRDVKEYLAAEAKVS